MRQSRLKHQMGLPAQIGFNRSVALKFLMSAMLVTTSISSNAQSLINYDRMSIQEEPVAYSVGGGILSINGALDIAYQSENSGLAEFDSQQLEGLFQYETQLANDWDVGASYRINYDTERAESTQDDFILYARDQWGMLSVGNVSRLLFDATRRQRAAGLLGVDNDNFTLSLGDYGAFYQWATPDTKWMISVDENANIETGIMFNKPIGKIEYQLAIRANQVENDQADAQGVIESQGLAAVGQILRGRWLLDAQLMSETVSLLGGGELDLVSLSAGLHAKYDRLNLSLTGASRENELMDTERSLSAGMRYDVSRGLSVNLGVNVFNTELISERFTSYSASVRYQF